MVFAHSVACCTHGHSFAGDDGILDANEIQELKSALEKSAAPSTSASTQLDDDKQSDFPVGAVVGSVAGAAFLLAIIVAAVAYSKSTAEFPDGTKEFKANPVFANPEANADDSAI